VTFLPSGYAGRARHGETLLEVAIRLGLEITAPCGGKGLCGKCAVAPQSDSQAALSPPDMEEQSLLRQMGYPEGWRLACYAKVYDDVTVRMPEPTGPQRLATDKTVARQAFEVDSPVQFVLVEIPPRPSSGAHRNDETENNLVDRLKLGNLTWPPQALKKFNELTHSGKALVTLAVWNNSQILDVRAGKWKKPLGLAIDLGTTTLAAYLCHLQSGHLVASGSAPNPQSKWGDDIISRIAYIQAHPDGLATLQREIMEAINQLAASLTKRVGATPGDILDATLVGNSVMHHIALGLSPISLGQVPFEPLSTEPLDIPAADLGLRFAPGARLHVLPVKAGFVGADAVAAVLALEAELEDEATLLVDIGTNGEVVFGYQGTLVCTSVPMGPVFEGGEIRLGMHTEPGAVERVVFDPTTGQFRYKIIGDKSWTNASTTPLYRARGFCGSAVLEIVAEALAAGLIEPSGRINTRLAFPCLTRTPEGQPGLIIVPADDSASGQPLVFTQVDVRSVQLAKAALRTSIDVLMEHLGLSRVERILLAGAFGTALSARHALALGMLPPCNLQRVSSVGNAAGLGACMALLNRKYRQRAVEIARTMKHIILPKDLTFQERLIEAMHFPPSQEAARWLQDHAWK